VQHPEPTAHDAAETREIARQAEVELAMLLGTDESLRIALQWMTRDRGNNHKLSTLRFHTWSFERHLSRIQLLADHGGYLHLVADAHPDWAGEIEALRNKREKLHSALEGIIVRLERVSRDDAHRFELICSDLGRFLDDFRAHGQKETELLQRSFAQEEGTSE
jgi:hypothetical protein